MSKRNLFEYRKPITLGPQGLLVDDLITGFEATTLQVWTTSAGGGATIAVVTTDAANGIGSLRIYSPNLASYVWAQRSAVLAQTGKHRLLAFVKIANYYGTTSNDYQFVGAFSGGAKYVLAIIPTALSVIGQHHGAVMTLQDTPLETGVWHKLEAETDYDALTSKFWINDVLVKEYDETAMIGSTVLYVGDTSASIMRGDFYWDTIMYGRTVE